MTDKPLAKRKSNELRDLIEGPDFRAQLLKALPNAMSPERFVRITATSMLRNPKLMQCSRETFFRCLLDLSAMGLEPDGRQAHLIPRKNKVGGMDCTLIVDYKGLKELLYRNGDIIDEHSDVVGDMDVFEYEFGSQKHLTHKPNVHRRGRIYCAYSYVNLPKGGAAFDVMSSEEIEVIRKRSANPDGDPWTRDWSEMAKKTVFKRLAKSLPLSPKTRDAIEVDNTYEMERQEPAAPRIAVVGRRELAPEPEDGAAQPGDELPEEDLAMPVETPTNPPEPVQAADKQDKPPGPLTRVKLALKESGFAPDELLTVLKEVRLVNANLGNIDHTTARVLEEVLSDWDNCLLRLKAGRAKQPEQEEFPA